MMRDTAIRRGVVRVVEDFRRAAGLSEQEFERVFASGDGPPATIGRDVNGRLMVPAVALWALGLASAWVLLALASAPLAVAPARLVLRESGVALNRALAQTARLMLAYGLLFAAGLSR